MTFKFSKNSNFHLDLDKNNGNNSNEARHYNETNDNSHCDDNNEYCRGVSCKRVMADSTKEVSIKKRKKSPKYGTCEANQDDANQGDATDQTKTFPQTVDECLHIINHSLVFQTVLNNMVKKRVILPNILSNLMGEQLFNVTKGNFENHKIPSAQDVATHVYQKIIAPYALVKKDNGDFSILITIGDFRNNSEYLTRKRFVRQVMKYTNQEFLTKLVEFSNARERKLQADEERIITSSMSGSESSFLCPPVGKKVAKQKQEKDKFLSSLSQTAVVVEGRKAKDVSNLLNYKNKNEAYVKEVAEKLKVILKNPNSI